MNKTSIEWTHRPGTVGMTWNPIRARLKGQGPKVHSGTFCTRISPGCTNCYASAINKRFGNGLEYTVPNLENVEFFLSEKILQEPLNAKKPCTIFVGDMFDLFHESIPQEMVAEVLRVAFKLPRHTFQFLTKRAERMYRLVNAAQEHWGVKFGPWMWFGVSVEDPQRAIERVPILRGTRASVRFLSVEPQLAFIDLGQYLSKAPDTRNLGNIDWVICGGESGPHSRPFNLSWAESLREQCRAAGVPFFMKQMGSYPRFDPHAPPHFPVNVPWGLDGTIKLRDRKGGDINEWPVNLRVREFPA